MNNKHMGVTYKEWAARRDGTSWKEKIRREIDTLVLASKNFDELAATLEEKGYEIKYGMHTSVRAPGQQRFTRLRTLGDDYTIDRIKSRIMWKDDLGNASHEDAYNKGQVLTICYADIITQLAKRIAEGKKKENKHDDSLPYLPHNDRDVFQLTAQLALINRMEIHSIADLDTKSKELEEKTKKLTDEFNAITVRHSETGKLLQQSELYNELSAKDRLSLSDKMRLQIIKQTLSHHDALDENGVERLTKEYHDLDERITALKTELESCENLKISYLEIKDTYNGISKGNYVSDLLERTHATNDTTFPKQAPQNQSNINEPQEIKKHKL